MPSRTMPTFVTEAIAEATGQSHRADPVTPTTGGPAGNARLTAWTGLVLLVLSAAEGITLLNIRGLISWHVVIGVLLIPPALLKTVSTGWRILRYYRGDPGYTKAGPPPAALRILGPAVVITTLGLLASGLVLILLGPDSSQRSFLTVAGLGMNAVTVHQAVFIAWFVVTTLHVLGRFVPALKLTISAPARKAAVPGASHRMAALVVVAAVAAVAGPLALYASGGWRAGDWHHEEGTPPAAHATGLPR